MSSPIGKTPDAHKFTADTELKKGDHSTVHDLAETEATKLPENMSGSEQSSKPAAFGTKKGLIVLGTVLAPFARFGSLLASGKDRVVSALQKFGEGVRDITRKCCENIKLPEKDKVDAEQQEKNRVRYAGIYDELFKDVQREKVGERFIEIMADDKKRMPFMKLVQFAGGDPREMQEFVKLYETASERARFSDITEKGEELKDIINSMDDRLFTFVEDMGRGVKTE